MTPPDQFPAMPQYRKPSAASSIATSIINRAGIVILNMSTGILTARTLHPVGRGELAAMNLWPLFLANATALGTPSSLIYYLRKHFERRDELILSALVLTVSLGSCAALAGAFLLPHWLGEYSPTVIHFAQLFLLAVPLWAIQITGQAALEALELFSLSNIVQTMIPATTLLGLLAFYLTDRLTSVTAAACYAVAIVPTSLTILVMLWRHREGARFRVTFSAWRTLFSYGVRSAPLDLLDTLSLYIDQVLVIGLLTAAAMGSYGVVLSLSRALLVFQSAVVMVLFPKAAGKSVATILTMVGQASRISLLVTGSAAVATALLGKFLIALFYGPQFLNAVPALRLLVLEVVAQGIVVVLSRGLMAAGKPGVVSILQGTGLALAIPLMFVFIPSYGVAGAALALLCSTLTRLILVTIAVPRLLHLPLPRLFPGSADVRYLVSLLNGNAA